MDIGIVANLFFVRPLEWLSMCRISLFGYSFSCLDIFIFSLLVGLLMWIIRALSE